jgi:hypothetical protein
MQTIEQMCADFPPDRQSRVGEELARDDQEEMPWYLRFIIAIGAWLASAFFISCGCVFFGWQPEHKIQIGVTGIALLVAAIVVNRFKLGIFIDQCALALSLAGQGMIYYGFVPETDSGVTATELSIGLAIVLYVLYPNFLSRLLTSLAALQITLWWLHLENGSWVPWREVSGDSFSVSLFVFWLLHLGLLGGCLLSPRLDRQFSPLGYATALSLAFWQVEDLFPGLGVLVTQNPHVGSWIGHWPWRAMMTAASVLGVACWSSGGLSGIARRQVLFTTAALTLIVLVWLGATGVLLALLLMLLGFSLGKRPILALGVLFFPIFLIDYYYSLELNLLTKSMVLAASGVVILALRACLMRFVCPEEVV